jgi:hypothetical protein
MVSDGMTYAPSFMNIRTDIQELLHTGTRTPAGSYVIKQAYVYFLKIRKVG